MEWSNRYRHFKLGRRTFWCFGDEEGNCGGLGDEGTLYSGGLEEKLGGDGWAAASHVRAARPVCSLSSAHCRPDMIQMNAGGIAPFGGGGLTTLHCHINGPIVGWMDGC